MECPKCRVDGRVALAEERDGELVRHYICPNPRCAMYRQEIGEVRQPISQGRAALGRTETEQSGRPAVLE